jgi:hypothetical protein
MKTSILAILLLTTTLSFGSTSLFASNCKQAAESAAEDKFRNLEFGCYGRARLVEETNKTTMRVYVEAIGGNGSCSQKVYEVKFNDSGRSCSIVSVKRIGLGGI